MSDLIVLRFENTYGAQQAMSAVRALTEMNYAWLDDVAVVVRHHSGRVSSHTTHGSVTAGAYFGGLIGMLIGLLFPPIGFLALFGAGAGVGALTQKAIKESGLDPNMMKKLKDSLQKGTSALIMIGATGDADQMARAFEKYNPVEVLRYDLPETTVEGLKDKLQDDEAVQQSDAPANADAAANSTDNATS